MLGGKTPGAGPCGLRRRIMSNGEHGIELTAVTIRCSASAAASAARSAARPMNDVRGRAATGAPSRPGQGPTCSPSIVAGSARFPAFTETGAKRAARP